MGPLENLTNLREIDENRFRYNIAQKRVMATLVYTPTCGTCVMAKKIMGVMAQSFPQISFWQINLNRHENLSQEFQITSVPCLLVHQDGRHQETIYLFGAASLYEKLEIYI